MPHPPQAPRKVNPLIRWSWILPIVSIGLLTFIPPILVAAKLRQKWPWLTAVGIAAAWLIGWMMVGTSPDGVDSGQRTVGMLLYLGMAVAAVVYVLALAPKIAWARPAVPAYDPNPAAIQEIREDRERRASARSLAKRDPEMARELRIGRPELPRQYDDGGLVDVNSVSAATMSRFLGMSQSTSEHVVEVRQHLGKFEQVEDLINLAGVDLPTFDNVKDRVILL